MQKTSQKEFRIEKVIKRKGDKLYVKWKDYDNSFNNWVDKKDFVWFYCIKWVNIFQNLMKDIVDILTSNYATKADIKNISHIDAIRFALKTNVANFKTEFEK